MSHRIILGTLGVLAALPGAYALKKQRAEAAALPWSQGANQTRILQGTWKNQLGSTLELEQDADGRLIGQYKTKVESKPGAAGPQPRRLYGNSSMKPDNPTFGFTVVYAESTASWAGQYYKNKGEDWLLTTWILTSRQDSIEDNWQANR